MGIAKFRILEFALGLANEVIDLGGSNARDFEFDRRQRARTDRQFPFAAQCEQAALPFVLLARGHRPAPRQDSAILKLDRVLPSPLSPRLPTRWSGCFGYFAQPFPSRDFANRSLRPLRPRFRRSFRRCVSAADVFE